MSRRDKRAGRVKYTREGALGWSVATNLWKAKFGKNWSHEMSMVMGLHQILQTPSLKKYHQLNPIRLKLCQKISDWVSFKAITGDFESLKIYANLLELIQTGKQVDPEAEEIILAYVECLRTNDRDRAKSLEDLVSRAKFPSGKDLALAMDRLRKEDGKPSNPKTLNAIRERALRLGLKLKGKRKKKK